MRIALMTALSALAALVIAPAAPAASAPVGATTLSAPRAVPLQGGGTGAVSYTATVTAGEEGIPLDTVLPPVSADVTGLGADGVDQGEAMAWLSPPEPSHFQFFPASTRLEHVYFTNEVRQEERADAMQPGDHADIAVADTVGNAVLPWDQPRSLATGRLEVRFALDAAPLRASYAGTAGTAEAFVGRADVIAVGGDVDARGGTVRASGTFDLGRTFPAGTPVSGAASVFSPFARYVDNIDIRVIPETGTLTLDVDMKGYLPQASEAATRDGIAATWHLPLLIALNVGTEGRMLPTTGLQVPAGGMAAVIGDDGPPLVGVPGGTTLITTLGAPPVLVDPLGDITAAAPHVRSSGRSGGGRSQAPPAPIATQPTALANEWVGATHVHRGMTDPVTVRAGLGRFQLVVDPDHMGEGVLAIRDLRDLRGGRTLAEVWSVPSAVVDGVRVPLDRSRLVDLRLFPQLAEITIGFTGLSDQSPLLRRVRAQFGQAHEPALHLVATYAIGEDRLLAVEWFAQPPGEDLIPAVQAITYQVALDGATPRVVSPVQLVGQPTAELSYGGAPRDREFADAVGGGRRLDAAGVTVAASTSAAAPTQLRAVRPPTSVTTLPEVRPRPFGTASMAAFFQIGTTSGSSSVVTSGPAATLGTTPPPALGVRCRPAEVTDAALDAPASIDVREAWVDSVGEAVRANIRVADLPVAAPSGSVLTYRVSWRHEHVEGWAQATLDAAGTWAFRNGPFTGEGVSGEVLPGAGGVIRISIPRTVERALDGELLRDTSARATLTTPAGTTSDQAQVGVGGYGLGLDHVIGAACP